MVTSCSSSVACASLQGEVTPHYGLSFSISFWADEFTHVGPLKLMTRDSPFEVMKNFSCYLPLVRLVMLKLLSDMAECSNQDGVSNINGSRVYFFLKKMDECVATWWLFQLPILFFPILISIFVLWVISLLPLLICMQMGHPFCPRIFLVSSAAWLLIYKVISSTIVYPDM